MLLRAAGARRFAHNWAVAKIKANADQWAAEATYDIPKPDRVRPLTYFTLAKLWTAAKPVVAPWADEHSTWTFRYGIRAAAEAHRAFLKGQRRFPRFKSRHTDRARFTITDGLRLEPGRVRMAKYGWVRVAAPCAAQSGLRRRLRRGRARLLNVTVTRHSDGHWYATLCFERDARVPDDERRAPTGPVVGVDRGVRTSAMVATADRQVVAELAGVRALRDARRKVAHLQRDLNRTKKRSANRRKAAARLGRAHARVAAVRADKLHAFTARLAQAHGVVVVEDLATANLLRNRYLAAAIADQGWAELARQLAYKTARHGGTLIVADRWFASSKTCSCCGWVKPKLSLAERTYTCGNDSCRLRADRDVNAAANLAAWGEAQLAGCIIQVGDRHPGGPSAGTCRHACGGSNEPAFLPAGASGEAGTSQPHVA
ncbi:MAG TPA: RNA-guided endonuclease TnpB family protein [Actinomycetales bacterium]|nr:RNA-guided endonuclease TnpB family protein [Actinomycetales bacterium]